MRRVSLAKWIQTALIASALVYGASLVLLWRDLNSLIHVPLLSSSSRRLDLHEEPSNPWDSPPHSWRPREFECLRWVGTNDDGEPTGETRECWQRVRGGDAGFCEVRNATSGRIFRVMRTTSLSLKDETRFTCRYAERFSSFRHQLRSDVHDPPMSVGSQHDKGIAMAVYDGILASAYASIRQLRDVGCVLPIELWTRHDEVSIDHPILRDLIDHFGPVRLRQIHDHRVRGFYVKTHAVYYSSFAKVLLLDADNFALRDPTALFFSRAFRRFGAVFWPDFWHPGNTIFNVHAQSLLWELLDLDYVDMLEQESGQVLIDRSRSRDALDRLMFLATQRPNILNKLMLVWGDKDLFRLAWLSAEKQFFFNDRRLPSSLGVINSGRERFCGLSMVQYDTDGESPLFVHRNTVKLTGELTAADGRQHIWKMLQEYAIDTTPPPTILSFNGAKLFNETSCFGVKRFKEPLQSRLLKMRAADTIQELIGLEDKLTRYAHEAWQLAQDDIVAERN